MMLRKLSIAAVLLLSTAAHAQTAPAGCSDSAGFSDFDFWLGEWDVYSNDEQKQYAGHNRISKHYGDCLVLEEWTSASGGGGMSMNFYNSVTDEWRQVWVASGYSIDYTGGLDDDGAMVLEGHLYSYAQNSQAPFRGRWTPQDDGSVIQHFDIYDADNDRWVVWFEGRYEQRDESD